MENDTNAHESDLAVEDEKPSLEAEFGELRQFVRENCYTPDGRNRKYGPFLFDFLKRDEYSFRVKRGDRQCNSRAINFILEPYRIIIIMDEHGAIYREISLTLTSNEFGLRQYKIDGQGEYSRLQVARGALGPFFC